MPDNSMISVYPFGDEYYTFTEAPMMHRIDPKTLETMDRVTIQKSFAMILNIDPVSTIKICCKCRQYFKYIFLEFLNR